MGKKLKAGVFGIGRGGMFATQAMNNPHTSLVAICDRDKLAAANFLQDKKDIAHYTDYDKFLSHDMDIVVVCNYCTEHAPAAIRALETGKHVLSEVIACKTLAEGVALCEAVQKAEKKDVFYMFAENYCYFSYCQEMERIYKSGKIGELRYAEGEYIHDCSQGWHALTSGPQHWRNWLPSTYYCTHSLGPIVKGTNLRPVKVTGFAVPNILSRQFGRKGDDWGILICEMENGAVVKIIPWSAGPHHSLACRMYGTDGMMQSDYWENKNILHTHFQKLWTKAKLKSYVPEFRKYKKQAEKTGHGGSDFFVWHEFVQSIRKKQRPPIDVYMGMDMTLPGILGYRSALAGNISIEIPDFRKEKDRKKYANDDASPDPNDKNRIPPSILGDIKIEKGIHAMIDKKRKSVRQTKEKSLNKELQKAYKV